MKTKLPNTMLLALPANMPYLDWIRVAAALKNEGYPFEHFNDWSKTAPEKYNEDVARKVWDSVGGPDHPDIHAGTLRYLVDKYNRKPLAKPQTDEELFAQSSRYLEALFAPEDRFELIPANPFSESFTRPGTFLTRQEFEEKFSGKTDWRNHACWIVLNPVKEKIAGQATGNDDIVDYRYVLVESDHGSFDEQWSKIRSIDLPIKIATWSGNKSIHLVVKIDAGNDKELYKERVRQLYDYLERCKFAVDASCKNPSRASRFPGVRHKNDAEVQDSQYIILEECGPKSWEDFERVLESPKFDRRALTSATNGQRGGRPEEIYPQEIAKNIVAQYTNAAGALTLRYYHPNETFWEYTPESGWSELKKGVVQTLITKFMQENYGGERIGFHKMRDVEQNLKAYCELPYDQTIPFWIDHEREGAFIRFKNGILCLVDGDVEFIQETPDYFSICDCNYSYTPDAKCPMWEEYMRTTFDSQELRDAVQMMFGYMLGRQLDLNIGFFLLGPGGDGKTTTAHILRKLLGDENCTSVSFNHLHDRFTKRDLCSHIANVCEELPTGTMRAKDSEEAEQLFKEITGGGKIFIERKCRDGESAYVRARCVFCANELPTFMDYSKALWDRLLVIPYVHRFRGTADEKKKLKVEMEVELPGILLWAIEGYRKVSKLTRFPVSEESKKILDAHRRKCDHVYDFLLENIEPDVTPQGLPPYRMEDNDLYSRYKTWAKENMYHPVSMIRFNSAVKNIMPETELDDGKWKGIRMSYPRKGCLPKPLSDDAGTVPLIKPFSDDVGTHADVLPTA